MDAISKQLKAELIGNTTPVTYDFTQLGVCMEVMIGTPSAGIVHAAYASSIVGLCLHYYTNPVFGRENEARNLHMMTLIGSSIGENRDKIVDEMLQKPCTHMLFIDDDMGFDQECLNIALMRKMPIVLANYRRKSPSAAFTARNVDNTENIETTAEKDSLEECSFGGFGFCLIERQVLEKMPKPRFLAYYDEEMDIYTTEDKPFYAQARAIGFPAFVDHRISKKVTHNGSYTYRWDDKLAQ